MNTGFTEPQQTFATPGDVLQSVTTMEFSLLPRSNDRAMINIQFDGGRPFSAEEETEFQIQVNANFLEGYKIAQSGILQMNTALLYKDRLANFKCLKGQVTKRQEWSESFTNNLQKALKQGRSGKKFNYLMLNRNAALTLHGVGALWWSNSYEWMPKFVSLDDLLIPSDTPLEMTDELGQFGINSWLTAWQLYQMTQSEKRDPGWNGDMAMKILRGMLESKNFIPDYFDKPEKMEGLWKQRSTYLNSDAVPKVKITTFYHQDPENGNWYRKVIVRENQAINARWVNPDEFLYNSSQTFAKSIDEILHIQYGDGSVVAPFKYRSVRGLGVLLYSVIELMNRLRCQFTQHVFSNLVPLLRVDNPQDRDRPRMLQMQPYSVVEPGVSFVKADERHQVDPRLVEESMSQFRQLMSENSSSYVQDIDNGTGKEQTLGEAQIKLQAANKIVSSMLAGAYVQEVFLYEEILRRFLMPVSGDKQVEEFQANCAKDGIPTELMETRCWKTEVPKAFGAGDQTLAQQQVTALLQLSSQLDPTARRQIQHDYISVITGNPDMAKALVPEQPNSVTSGRKAAEDVFGTLMNGVQVGLREGIEQTDYIAAMMAAIDSVIAQIKQTDNVGTQEQLIGLQTAMADAEKHLQLLEQDPTQKQFVTAAGKEIGAMNNELKAFGQRQQEKAQQGQVDPAAEAEIHTMQVRAAQEMHISEQKSQQAMQQKQAAFDQKTAQDQQKFSLEMTKMMAEAKAQMEQQQADLDAMSGLPVITLM
jgi:hypothetical protein